MSPAVKTLLRLALLCGVLAAAPATAFATTSAAALSPCGKKLMTEWAAGYIKDIFPHACYQSALQYISNTPELSTYSSAADDVQRAEQAASQGKHAPLEEGARSSTTPTTPSSSHSSGGSSLPLPLIILGAVAVALVLAGGIGMLWQRRRGEPPSA